LLVVVAPLEVPPVPSSPVESLDPAAHAASATQERKAHREPKSSILMMILPAAPDRTRPMPAFASNGEIICPGRARTLEGHARRRSTMGLCLSPRPIWTFIATRNPVSQGRERLFCVLVSPVYLCETRHYLGATARRPLKVDNGARTAFSALVRCAGTGTGSMVVRPNHHHRGCQCDRRRSTRARCARSQPGLGTPPRGQLSP
jgi:hypothetical protein